VSVSLSHLDIIVISVVVCIEVLANPPGWVLDITGG